jgi:hypothetical protein
MQLNSVYGVKGTTPLLKIFEYPAICMIDYMHFILLGATKFLRRQWFQPSQSKGVLRKFKKPIQKIINEIKFPSSVHRKCLLLNDHSKWKASECRLFLLYVAPVVLIKFMSQKIPYNFLSFALG